MEQNENANPKQNEYSGVQTPIEQIDAEQEQQKKAAQADSKWRTIEDGRTADMSFTGNVFKRTAEWEGKPTHKLGFELTDKTSKGEHKVFEIGDKSSTSRDLVKRLKQAKAENKLPLRLFIKRTGVKAATRYEVSEPE